MRSHGLALLVAFALGACGKVSADSDAGADGGEGPSEGQATVTVYDESGLRQSFVDVVFQNAAGEVVQKLSTNAIGQATALVHIGDQVSVTRDTNFGTKQVTTFVGVKPGDQLIAGNPREHARSNEPYGTLNFFVIPLSNASSYAVSTVCEDSITTDAQGLASVSLFDSCHDPNGNIPVLALAFDAQLHALNYALRPSVPQGGVGTYTMDASEWRSDFASTAISIVNTPTTNEGTRPFPNWLVQTAGREQQQFIPTIAGDPQPGDNINATALYPKGLGAAFVHTVETYGSIGTVSTYRLIAGRKRTTAPASVSIDANDLLPQVSAREVVGSGDAARPQLTWSFESALDGVDGLIVQLAWDANGGTLFQEWIVIAPPGTTQLKLPALPDSLAGFRPSVDSSLHIPNVVAVDLSSTSGYDAFRNRVGWFPQSFSGSYIRLFADEDASLRVSATE
jgi:hypothetical protein